MNTLVKAARASPIQPAIPAPKPAGGKGVSAALNFAELLGGELKKSKSPAPSCAPAEKDPPERESKTSTPSAGLCDPLGLLNAAAVTPPPTPPQAEAPRSGSGEADKTAQTGSPAAVQGEAAAGTAAGTTAVGTAANAASAALTSAAATGAEVMNTQLAAAFKAALQGTLTAAATDQPAAVSAAAEGQPQAAAASADLAQKAAPASQPLNDLAAGFQTRVEVQPANLTSARTRLNDQSGAIAAPTASQPELKTTGSTKPAAAQPNTAADPLQSARVQTSPAAKAAQTPAAAEPVAAAVVQNQAQPVEAGSLARALQASGDPAALNLAGAAATTLEPARTAEAQNKGMIWQVCQNVETMLKNRQSTLRVMLFPAEMGRIDLRLTTGSNGLGISLIAQQSSTNQLLEGQVTQLRQALADAGIHLAHLNVGQQHSQAGSGQSNQQLPRQTSHRISAVEEDLGAESLLSIASLEPSGGYDYRI